VAFLRLGGTVVYQRAGCRAELDALKGQGGLLLGRQEDIGWQFRYSPSTGDLRELVDRLVCY